MADFKSKKQSTHLALSAVLVLTLTACQSKPELKQVPVDAVDKPINSPEAIERLKKSHEK